MASITQKDQTTLAPCADGLDVQDRPLRDLRCRFDYLADFRVKALECAGKLFPAAKLPRGLRMPVAFRARNEINLLARLFDVVNQDVAARPPPFGAISHFHAAE